MYISVPIAAILVGLAFGAGYGVRAWISGMRKDAAEATKLSLQLSFEPPTASSPATTQVELPKARPGA